MRCQEVRCWTVSGLVAAFLDLSVAFSLLCVSCFVYLTSKILGLFGLSLPCPCDGLFSDPHKNKCFQETLVNLPVKKISSVQRCVKNRTPFDSVLYKEANGVELEKEGFSKEVENASCLDLLTSQSLKKASFKVKRNHCQSRLENNNSPLSPASLMEYLNDVEENDPLLVSSKDCGKTLEDVSLRKSVSLCCIAQNKQPSEILEQAALALELEEERDAAATAADEALGMILRLQEEKASIEMEARQYQRMIEEKSAFDAEEMTILKEILLRREREKFFLEKEVDTYRQMFLETEQPLSKSLDDSSGIEIFANQMDNRIPKPGEVDNDWEMKVNQSRREGLLIDTKPHEIEQGSSFSEPDPESKKVGEDSHDIGCGGHDIHVVNDEVNKVQQTQLDRSQSVLDTSYGLPQGQRKMSPNMRRNSMSAVDYERPKIESEVGLLRGRLRAVQKGREKLSFFSKEQSRSQVQRFGDKTSRFWEARRSGPLNSSSPSSTMVKAMSMTLDLHSA